MDEKVAVEVRWLVSELLGVCLGWQHSPRYPSHRDEGGADTLPTTHHTGCNHQFVRWQHVGGRADGYGHRIRPDVMSHQLGVEQIGLYCRIEAVAVATFYATADD